jgi:hypothetical protein
MRVARGLSLAVAISLGGAASAEDLIPATMYKMPYCTCCEGHADYLRANGFNVEIKEVDDLAPLRRAAGVPEAMEGCHVIKVGGLIVEGHISAPTIEKLLSERPDGVIGISMPGMPSGVPGMPGTKPGPIDVFAFGHGQPTVYAVE